MDEPTLLIDGDLMCYQASAAVEHETNWGDDLWTLHANATDAYKVIQNKMQELFDHFLSQKVVVAFSSPDNFRKDVLPTYKANRAKTRKPVCYRAVVAFMQEHYPSYLRPRLEADDILGILATSHLYPGTKVIVTEDKDLKQIPGFYHKPSTGETVEISLYEADWQFYMQALHGDMTDGYAGCPGVGPVKAEKLLAPAMVNGTIDHEQAWGVIKTAYAANGLSEEEALAQARVARILRKKDYNFKTRCPRLWTPSRTTS